MLRGQSLLLRSWPWSPHLRHLLRVTLTTRSPRDLQWETRIIETNPSVTLHRCGHSFWESIHASMYPGNLQAAKSIVGCVSLHLQCVSFIAKTHPHVILCDHHRARIIIIYFKKFICNPEFHMKETKFLHRWDEWQTLTHLKHFQPQKDTSYAPPPQCFLDIAMSVQREHVQQPKEEGKKKKTKKQRKK